MDSYKRNADYWNKIFSKENSADVTSKTTGQEDICYGLANSILDF